MRLFYDEALSKPVGSEGINFGEVWLSKEKTQTIWILNDNADLLHDVTVKGLNENVTAQLPNIPLTKGEKAQIKLTWKPNLLKGLKATLQVECTEVYGS